MSCYGRGVRQRQANWRHSYYTWLWNTSPGACTGLIFSFHSINTRKRPLIWPIRCIRTGGVFLLVGYSSTDESLLRPHTNLGVQDAVRALQHYMVQHINNQVSIFHVPAPVPSPAFLQCPLNWARAIWRAILSMECNGNVPSVPGIIWMRVLLR